MISPGSLLLGKYRIAERLGEGGMGTVFRARDELLDRDVAIKLLRTELAGDAALAERFRGEAIALARLAHPAIAALHGLEREGDRLYMVMEFVRGETLESRIQREGSLGWRDAARVCAAVCVALEHAHSQGVVHRDIKPANVMMVPDGSVKVMDFGIARMAGQSRQTRMGSTVGTPHYMAPEQLRGEEVDGRADLYSLGAVLFELISGKVPFEADSDYRLMMKQLHDPPPRLSGEVAGVPRSIDRVVQRALAKDRAARFATAAELRSALETTANSPEPDRVGAPGVDGPLHLDWRTWAAGAMVLVALLVLFTGKRPAAPAAEPDSPPVDPLPTSPTAPASFADRPLSGTDSLPVTISGTLPIPPAAPPPPPPPDRGNPPPRQREGDPRPQPVPVPAPAPPPAPPAPARSVEPSTLIDAAVREWFAGLKRRDPGGLSGQLGDKPLAALISDGTASVEVANQPRIAVDGDRATATAPAIVSTRSSFGSSRKSSATFHFTLQATRGGWRIAGVRVTSD